MFCFSRWTKRALGATWRSWAKSLTLLPAGGTSEQHHVQKLILHICSIDKSWWWVETFNWIVLHVEESNEGYDNCDNFIWDGMKRPMGCNIWVQDQVNLNLLFRVTLSIRVKYWIQCWWSLFRELVAWIKAEWEAAGIETVSTKITFLNPKTFLKIETVSKTINRSSLITNHQHKNSEVSTKIITWSSWSSSLGIELSWSL